MKLDFYSPSCWCPKGTADCIGLKKTVITKIIKKLKICNWVIFLANNKESIKLQIALVSSKIVVLLSCYLMILNFTN